MIRTVAEMWFTGLAMVVLSRTGQAVERVGKDRMYNRPRLSVFGVRFSLH